MADFETLQAENGGRPLANDDLLVLQSQGLALGLSGLLAELRGCVVNGCRVYQTGSVWNVGPGLVWTGGQLLPFAGQSNVTLPALLVAGPVQVVDERAYETGGTRTTILSQAAQLVAYDPATAGVYLDVNGGLTIWQMVANQTREVGTVEYVQDVSSYDATGLGYGNKQGWGLCNGQGGRVDLGGRFVAGAIAGDTSYAPLTRGGQASVTLQRQNLPPNPAGTGDVLTYTGNPTGLNVVPSGANGWQGRQPLDGRGTPLDTRPPYVALVARQWLGLG